MSQLIKLIIASYKFPMVFFSALISGFLKASIILLVNYFLKYFLDAGVIGDKNRLLFYGSCLLVVMTFSALFNAVSNYFSSKAGLLFFIKVRSQITEKIAYIKNSVLEKINKGEMLSKINYELVQVRDYFGKDYSGLFFDIFRFLFVFVLLATVHFKLLLFATSIVPLILFFISKITNELGKLINKSNCYLGMITGSVQDTINGLTTIRTYNAQEFAQKYFRKNLKKYYQVQLKMSFWQIVIQPLTEIILKFSPVMICVVYGGFLLMREELSMGGFFIFSKAIWHISMPLNTFSKQLFYASKINKCMDSINDLFKLPVEKKQEKLSQDNVDLKRIKTNNLSFSYDHNRKVIENLNLTLKAGQKLGIIGTSGCGKTTFINLLCKFYDKYSGNFCFNDKEIAELSPEELRSYIAIVGQTPQLFLGTIAENIAMGKGSRNVSRKEIIQAAKMAEADWFISRLPNNYDYYLGEQGCLLSGGQKQRIAIARALIKQAPILILDEPTSALDKDTAKKIHKILCKIGCSKTIIEISHDLNQVKNYDFILEFKEGRFLIHRGKQLCV